MKKEMKKETKKEKLHKHLFILLLGFVAASKGTSAAALTAKAVSLFRSVPTVSGYSAIVKFAAGIALVCAALLLFYSCGRDIVKGGESK